MNFGEIEMNERIKQLAEQAGMGYGNLTTGNGDNWIVAGKPEQLEKFAELIVEECAGIARQHNNSGEGGVIAESIEVYFKIKGVTK